VSTQFQFSDAQQNEQQENKISISNLIVSWQLLATTTEHFGRDVCSLQKWGMPILSNGTARIYDSWVAVTQQVYKRAHDTDVACAPSIDSVDQVS
jgi:hypothetical protein